ncbi:aminotransferase class I/II-fold pyridoxal phosphate-dependent enzyme [Verminephrobacter eiseniae]
MEGTHASRRSRALQRGGYDYDMSHTNFVLANVGGGTAFARKLDKHGLIVRPVTSYGLTDWVRISIGTSSEIDRFLKAARPE